MEGLLNFDGSRRVIIVPYGSSLFVAIEQDLFKRFPDRDITIAVLTTQSEPIPESSTKDMYIVRRKTDKWRFVDVTDPIQVVNGDELTVTKVGKKEPTLTVIFILFILNIFC